MPEVSSLILRHLQAATGPLTLAELAEQIGLSPDTVREAVWYLLDHGDVSLDRDWRVVRAPRGDMPAAAGACVGT